MPNKNFKKFTASILILSMLAVEFSFAASAHQVVVVNKAASTVLPSAPTSASNKQISIETLKKDIMEIYNPPKKTKSNQNLRAPQNLGPCGKTTNDQVVAIFDPANDLLTIQGKGQMADYNELNFTSAPWYEHSSKIDTVLIDDGVTSIGDFAFHSLTNLLKVDISRTVKTIGEAAFKGCSKLTTAKFDSSSLLEEIGVGAFKNTGIVSLKFPDKLNKIGDDAFKGCQKLYCVTFGTTAPEIGDGAFSFCDSLYFMSYSANKKPSCNKSVFSDDMTSLKEIRVPNTCDYGVNDFCGVSLKKVNPDELAKCVTKEEDMAKEITQVKEQGKDTEKKSDFWDKLIGSFTALNLVGTLTAIAAIVAACKGQTGGGARNNPGAPGGNIGNGQL